jgi:hypothetical protein
VPVDEYSYAAHDSAPPQAPARCGLEGILLRANHQPKGLVGDRLPWNRMFLSLSLSLSTLHYLFVLGTTCSVSSRQHQAPHLCVCTQAFRYRVMRYISYLACLHAGGQTHATCVTLQNNPPVRPSRYRTGQVNQSSFTENGGLWDATGSITRTKCHADYLSGF